MVTFARPASYVSTHGNAPVPVVAGRRQTSRNRVTMKEFLSALATTIMMIAQAQAAMVTSTYSLEAHGNWLPVSQVLRALDAAIAPDLAPVLLPSPAAFHFAAIEGLALAGRGSVKTLTAAA